MNIYYLNAKEGQAVLIAKSAEDAIELFSEARRRDMACRAGLNWRTQLLKIPPIQLNSGQTGCQEIGKTNFEPIESMILIHRYDLEM